MQPYILSSTLLVRGIERATSASQLVQPHRGQQSSAAVVVPKVGGAKPVSATGAGGRLNNAAEFAVTKLDDLVNWGRRVRKYCRVRMSINFGEMAFIWYNLAKFNFGDLNARHHK